MIRYYPRMTADNKKRLATFWENVEVYNFPANDLDATLDPTPRRLPQGAIHLRCTKRLDVLGKQPQQPGGRTSQEMTAQGHVQIWGPDYQGVAETLSYNEGKDQLVLRGGSGGMAILAQTRAVGGDPNTSRAEEVIYFRKTGEVKMNGVDSFSGRN